MKTCLSLSMAIASFAVSPRTQGAPLDEHGFELVAPASLTLPAEGRQSFRVALEIPEGFYVTRDADLGVPALEVSGLGSGVDVELGPEAEPATKADAEVYYELELSRTTTR